MQAEPGGGTETILCVDDDEAIRTTLSKVLAELEGYTVLVAKDGVEGWELFQRHQHTIDLTILDLAMPRMSGQELLSLIRKSDPRAKVIVTTGHPELGLPVDALVKKPYRLAELLAIIRSLLDGDE